MTNLMKTLAFTQDDDDGRWSVPTEHRDRIVARNLLEAKLLVEGDGPVEVAHRNERGANCPSLCDLLSWHFASSVSQPRCAWHRVPRGRVLLNLHT